MNTGFLWINTPSSSTHSSSCEHSEEIPNCIPAFPALLEGQRAACAVEDYIMLLKGYKSVKNNFPSLQKLFWIFLLEALTVPIDKFTPLRCLIFCQI